jgi:hypothetical protein
MGVGMGLGRSIWLSKEWSGWSDRPLEAMMDADFRFFATPVTARAPPRFHSQQGGGGVP